MNRHLARIDLRNLAPCFGVRLEKRHPVSDSKAKKNTLIGGTSPYGTYMALPPPPGSYRSVPVQKVVRRGVAFTRVRKKSSGPFQNRSRNWAVWKSEQETGTIRYGTVPFSCEQKDRSSLGPLSGPVWFKRVTPSWCL